MALEPEIDFPFGIEDDNDIEPSRTYKLDIETGVISYTKVDGAEAIKQFITKALNTIRYNSLIYSSEYGTEFYDLLSEEDTTEAYSQSEIERLVTETLIYDERIDEVSEFHVTIKHDSVFVSFNVYTTEGVIKYENEFNVIY